MELYTNSQPILIGEHVTSLFNHMFDNIETNNKNIFEKIYDDVIHPNIYIFAIIAMIVCFLMYRYFKHTKPRNELYDNTTINNPNKTWLSEDDQYIRGVRVFGGMDHPKERIARPTFNPSIPISKQQSYVNYLPDEIPVDVNGQLKNNILPMEYIAPQNNSNNIQYGGPIYKSGENGLSDDIYRDFVDSNKQNLMEFDDLLQQKTIVS